MPDRSHSLTRPDAMLAIRRATAHAIARERGPLAVQAHRLAHAGVDRQAGEESRVQGQLFAKR